jgi:hypothetical protein
MLFLTGWANAQTTRVSGRVKDGNTKELLPYVTVRFVDSKIGTTSNDTGYYKLDTYYATDSLEATSFGYRRARVKVTRDIDQTVDVLLFPIGNDTVPEVVIKPPEVDPAIAMFKKILRYKEVNNKEKLKSYQYEVYTKVEFDVNNISDEFKNRKVFKPIKFIFENIDSTTSEKPYLPLFITESLSDFYFRKNPQAHREYINASQVSGFENKSVSQFLGDMYQNINVYENYVNIFGRNFVSPVSDRGLFSYDYRLSDSAMIGNNWCYKIKFYPKRKAEPVFIGHFWMNDTTYAIRKIECDVVGDANLNFIKTFAFKQEFEQVKKEVWMVTSDYLLVDFNVFDKQMGCYGRKTTTYKNFVINKPREDAFYAGAQNVIVGDDATDKSHEYWDSARHVPLTPQERLIYDMMDTILKVPEVKTFNSVVSMLASGYKTLGKFEYGPYFTTYSFNPYEGPRFRTGGRTSNAFSKRIEFNGYLAYGTRDKQFKWGGGFRTMLSKKPRQQLAVNYKHDVEMLGFSSNAFRQDNILASVFRRTPPNKMTFIDEYKFYYEYEYFQGLNNQLHLRHRTITPVGVYQYAKVDKATGDTLHPKHLQVAELTYYLRFAYDEKYVSGEFDRTSMGTTYPVFDVQYSLGIKGVLGSDYGYHKVVTSVQHWFNVGGLGYFKYRIEAGKYFGVLPYPLLELHRGNNTYYFDNYAFNLMNLYEFVSDQYVSVQLNHHFQGFFLNHFPLLRKLKWREVATFKAVWGSVSEKNRAEMVFPNTLYNLNVPYMEFSVGVENIFKFLRFDFVQRLTYLNHKDIAKWGFRVRFDIDF